jgi:hypothetical protein
VLNAVAGGGSFLLFPAMLGMKMLPVQANATNTVALWPGQLTSVAAYRDDIRKNRRLALAHGAGRAFWAGRRRVVLLNTPQTTFLHLVPWLLLVAASIFAADRAGRAGWPGATARNRQCRRIRPGCCRLLCTIVVCFYIGYFGAGAGFLLITLLSLFGFQDLNEINALKVVHHDGQRHRLPHLCGGPPGGMALLPAGHGHLRHRRLHLGPLRAHGAAARPARHGHLHRLRHGGLVLLEKPVQVTA